MNVSRNTQRYPYWLAIILIVALLVTTMLLMTEKKANAVTLTKAEFPSMCFDPLLTSTVILDPSACELPMQNIAPLHHETEIEQSVVPPVIIENEPPVVDNGGGNTSPTKDKECKNANRQGHKNCSKNPDTNSGQQHTTEHGKGKDR